MRRAACALWLLLAPLAGCARHEEASEATTEESAGATAADSGIVVLTPESVARAGIATEAAGEASIDVTLTVPGEVKADPQRVLEVKPRFPGVVRDLRKAIGQSVGRGETVAMVESNESLTTYAVTSAIAGRVVARPVARGQTVTQETVLCTIADLSHVWVEFGVYANQIGRIRAGEAARVTPQAGGAQGTAVSATVSYVGPTLDQETRVSTARIVLPNAGGRWEPGMFVDVTVTVDHAVVPVAVLDAAIVRTAEGAAVFVAHGTRFQKQVVQVGRSDGRHTEILSGLDAGAPVVTRNAFALRSELEKSEVEE